MARRQKFVRFVRAGSRLVHARTCLNMLVHASPCLNMLDDACPCLNRQVHQLTLPWTSPFPASLNPSDTDTLFFFMDLSLRAILLEIVLLGLRSPRPPLWGAGRSVKPRLFPFSELLSRLVPIFVPLYPLTPLLKPFLVIIEGQDGPVGRPSQSLCLGGGLAGLGLTISSQREDLIVWAWLFPLSRGIRGGLP